MINRGRISWPISSPAPSAGVSLLLRAAGLTILYAVNAALVKISYTGSDATLSGHGINEKLKGPPREGLSLVV